MGSWSDPAEAAAEIEALELGDAGWVVVNGGCIIRCGDKCPPTRGRKGILIAEPKAVGGDTQAEPRKSIPREHPTYMRLFVIINFSSSNWR